MTTAAFANRGRIDHHPLARKVLGEGLALGPLARKSTYRGDLGYSPLRRNFVFGRAGLQLLEGQRQLLDQPRRTLRSLAVELTCELGDLKFLMRDQCVIFSRLGVRNRKFGRDL